MTSWLSMHADYGCRHAGACCTSRWPIPIEAARARLVRAAVADGRVSVAEPWLLPGVAASAVAAPAGAGARHASADDADGLLATTAAGHCVFHQHDRCAIHGALGHQALPSACQHFPRVCLIDPRGVFVTLSHYCPTAAAMLFDDRPVSIVEGRPAVPGQAVPEGLDARDVWPPLLTGRVLMDHASYTAWERHMVDTLAGEGSDRGTPEDALARLREDAEWIASWTPGGGELMERIVARQSGVGSRQSERQSAVGGRQSSARQSPLDVARGDPEPVEGSAVGRRQSRARRMGMGGRHVSREGRAARALAAAGAVERANVVFDVVRGAVPVAFTWPEAPRGFADEWRVRVAPTWLDWAPVVRRFLTAHAFASWVAYQGRGILSIVTGLDAVLAVLKVELVRACQEHGSTVDRATLTHAIRQADLLLRHHAERQALADRLSALG